MAQITNITPEIEEKIEALFKDARNSSRDMAPSKHKGRLLDEIDDDIDAVRSALDLEL